MIHNNLVTKSANQHRLKHGGSCISEIQPRKIGIAPEKTLRDAHSVLEKVLGHEQNFPKQTMDLELDQPLPNIKK
jgi:hypothetical protein